MVKIEEKQEALIVQQERQAELGNGNISAVEDKLMALLQEGGFESRVAALCDPLLEALEKRLSEPIQRLGKDAEADRKVVHTGLQRVQYPLPYCSHSTL